MNAESLTGMVEHLDGDARLLGDWAQQLHNGFDGEAAAMLYRAAWQIREAADALRKVAGFVQHRCVRPMEGRQELGLDEIRER